MIRSDVVLSALLLLRKAKGGAGVRSSDKIKYGAENKIITSWTAVVVVVVATPWLKKRQSGTVGPG